MKYLNFVYCVENLKSVSVLKIYGNPSVLKFYFYLYQNVHDDSFLLRRKLNKFLKIK